MTRSFWFRAALALLASTACSYARLPDGRAHANVPRTPAAPRVTAPADVPVVSRNGTQLPPYTQVYTFQQLIDHNNPSLGTFTQRFWHTWEFYEQGGPIIIFTPGEIAADGKATAVPV